jgi:hypothetical protein
LKENKKSHVKIFSCYSEVKSQIWYMYEELINTEDYVFQTINNSKEIATYKKHTWKNILMLL